MTTWVNDQESGSISCPSCSGTGKRITSVVDLSDIDDKLDDIMDRLNDIFEQLSE